MSDIHFYAEKCPCGDPICTSGNLRPLTYGQGVMKMHEAEDAAAKLNDYARLQLENSRLTDRVGALESLRPHWAKGHSADSVAAQASTAALSQLWSILGVDNQTAAVAAARRLTAQGDSLPDSSTCPHGDHFDDCPDCRH